MRSDGGLQTHRGCINAPRREAFTSPTRQRGEGRRANTHAAWTRRTSLGVVSLALPSLARGDVKADVPEKPMPGYVRPNSCMIIAAAPFQERAHFPDTLARR